VQLELSSEGRYALRALVYPAWADERVTADRIPTDAHIPRRLLVRIVAKLSHHGLVESEQGRGGGSRLAPEISADPVQKGYRKGKRAVER
jgi:DNA-binding IscR family transcriptional regulator